MRMDAMHRPVIDRTYPQTAFEAAPRFLDPLQLLVPQGQIGWREAIIVTMHHKLAIHLFGGTPFGGVDAQEAAFGQAQIAPIATAGPQLTYPFAVALTTDGFERRQFGLEFTQDLLAVDPLAFFLLGIVAHDIATTALALAHHHCLDPQVVRYLLKTPWALEDVVGHFVAAAHRHTDDVFTPARAEPLEVLLGNHPGIAHEDATAQFPPLQIVFDLGHGCDIHGIAREHPVSHRQAIAGDRQPNDDLRGITAAIFRHPPLAWCLIGLGTCRYAAFHQVVITIALIHLVDFKMQGGGVVEDQLHIQVEQIGEAEIQRLLNIFLVSFKHIHGAVEMVQIERVRSCNTDVLTQPLLITVELGAGRTGSVGYHGKERPFDREIEFAALELLRDDIGEAQALPQRFQDVEWAVGPGINQAPLGGVLHNLVGITFFKDTAGEVAQTLCCLGVLSAAAIVEHADLRALFVRIPHALDQLKMGDEGAISTFLTGFTHIHVRKDKEVHSFMSSQTCKSMYLGF